MFPSKTIVAVLSMTKDTLPYKFTLAGLQAVLCLTIVISMAACGQKASQSDPEQPGPAQPQPEKSGPAQPIPNQPALPRDSMVEAMVRIQLAEAYRSRYYVFHEGASAEPPSMDSLYALALAPLGITRARYEANYREMLDHDPTQLQALYDSCESILQRRLIGLR